MNRLIALAEENNKMLKEIRAMLYMQLYDNNYISQQDNKAFCINVAADIFVEMLEDNKEFKDKVKNNLKNIKL